MRTLRKRCSTPPSDIAEQGVDALSLRDVARDAGTTTRAIYTLFGSKDGLLGALGVRAFNLLQREIEALPRPISPPATSSRWRSSSVASRSTTRRSSRSRSTAPTRRSGHASAPPPDALAVLNKRFGPLADADLLGGRSISEASIQFRALCEGLAWTELRGNPLPPDPERFWRNAFHALVTGFAAPAPDRPRHISRRRRRQTAAPRDTGG